ncbi:MAG: MFS transporter [Coriobacteriales bacterium]|nr:MFS transporter [Coriobacteriales bacterium]
MKVSHPLHPVSILVAALAFVMLLMFLGTAFPPLPWASVPFAGPTIVASDGTLTAVADTDSRRVLILDKDGLLTGIIDCESFDAPIDAVTDLCVANGQIYVVGVRFAPDSDMIQEERVLVYHEDGKLQKTLYEINDSPRSNPAIISVNDANSGIVAAIEQESVIERLDSINYVQSLLFLFIDKDGEQHVIAQETNEVSAHDAAYSANESNHYAILSTRGLLDDDGVSDFSQVYEGRVFTAVDIDDDGIIYTCDDVSGSACVISTGTRDIQELVVGQSFDNLHVNNGVLSLCSRNGNRVILCTLTGEMVREYSVVNLSMEYVLRVTIVWVSALYLILFALIQAIRIVRNLIKAGHTEGISAMLTSIAVVMAVVTAVGNLSYDSYEQSLETRAHEINMCANYLEIINLDLSESMENINNREFLRKSADKLEHYAADFDAVSSPPLYLVLAAQANNIGLYFTLYGKDDNGVFYLVDSASEHMLGTSARSSVSIDELEAAFELDYRNKGKMLTGHTLRDTTQYMLVRIMTQERDGIAGVIEIGSKMHSFRSSVTGNLMQQILNLLVMVFVVYLAYVELRACGCCLFSYRELQKRHVNEAAAVLTRPFSLSVMILTSVDSVMTVLIARELLPGIGLSDSSPLLGLPAVMLGVGLIIGQSLYGYMGSRVGLRRLVLGGAFAILICASATGLVVLFGNFWMYCAAKLALSVPFGLLNTLAYSLPRLAVSDETRVMASKDIKRTDTSAVALGTILGGYAAQGLGNEWVYAFVALGSIPVFVTALNLLPKGMLPPESIAKTRLDEKRIFAFIRTPTALAIALFIILPSTVAAGYASFLFPLFSADIGLSKASINNICVLGQVIVFLCIHMIERVEIRFGKWRVAVSSIALLGAVFVLFSVNTTLIWSVVVIALAGILRKASDAWKALWLHAADYANVNAGIATGAMFATRSLTLIVQPFILTALMSASASGEVIIIGLFCFVCAGLFFLITKEHKFSLHQEENSETT